GTVPVTQDESRNNAVARRAANEAARADVRQFRGSRLIEIVNLDQADAGRVVIATDDSRVGTGRQRNIDGGFTIVGRRDAARLDLRFLRIAPVVVYDGLERALAVQLEDRIGQRILNAKARQ